MSKPFVIAAKSFFGLKPGESLSEFQAEIKALSEKDKIELAKGLEEVTGEAVTLPAPQQ